MSPQAKESAPTAAEAAAGENYDGPTVKLKWKGPDDQFVVGVGNLKNGESYDVPKDIAKSLQAGSDFWGK